MPPRADGLRLMRYAIGLLFVAVIALAVLVVVAFSAIQSSRQDSIRSQCLEQNERHEQTLAAYDRVLLERLSPVTVDPSLAPNEVTRRLLAVTRKLPKDRRMQVEQARSSMAFLMQRLAPRRDCDKRVQRLVK